MQPYKINKPTINFHLWMITQIASALLIGLSVCTLLFPWNSYLQLIKLSGIGILLSGIHLLALFSAEKSSSKSANWILAEEMLNCFFGTLLTFNLLFTFFLFAFFTGIWAIAWGILKALYALFEKEKINDWYFLSAQGACAITIGVLLLTNPFMKTWHTIQWTAVLMLLVGLLNLLVNLKNKAYRPGRPAFI